MLDWSYANGIGFTSFHVWCGADPQGLSNYKACGLESVVANLQTYYPPTSSSPFWGWSSLGGQLASGTGPAVCAQNASSLDAFVQGTDHALWYTHWDGTKWSSWKSLGGNLTSPPAATSPANGVIDVFVRSTDGALWFRSTTNGGAFWSSWSSLGEQLASGTGPAVCAQNASSLDAFVQGTDHALWHKSFQGSAWSAWGSLAGNLTSSPAATSPANGVIDVLARGSDGAVWERGA